MKVKRVCADGLEVVKDSTMRIGTRDKEGPRLTIGDQHLVTFISVKVY